MNQLNFLFKNLEIQKKKLKQKKIEEEIIQM